MNLPNHLRGSKSCPRVLLACALGLTLAAVACEPEEQGPNFDDWRLGVFEMTWNGERRGGDLAYINLHVDQRNDVDADARFTFINQSADLYEDQQLLFTIQRKVGRYDVDTILPAGIHPDDWPHPEVRFYYSIEHGHVSGATYAPILHDTIADFIAVDSIVDGLYHGRFQVSLVAQWRDTINTDAPDTIIIRDGRFATREYRG